MATLIEPMPAPKLPPPPPVRMRLPPPVPHVARAMPTPLPLPVLKVEAKVPTTVVVPVPEAPRIEASKPEAAKMAEPHIDLPPAPVAPKPIHEVKLGGFGDPNGVPPSPASHSRVLAQAGSFDLPQGAGRGGGSGTAKVVASAGFGDGVASFGGSGAGGSGRGSVRAAGFGDTQTQAVVTPHAAVSRVPVQTPVEIISKPRPAYTPEARASKLEGEVLLEVVFSSAGAVQVIKVVRGLGLGLDESAWQAASQIRFRPGTRDGVPVDMKGIVHIVFELS
jgi:TonB family protein